MPLNIVHEKNILTPDSGCVSDLSSNIEKRFRSDIARLGATAFAKKIQQQRVNSKSDYLSPEQIKDLKGAFIEYFSGEIINQLANGNSNLRFSSPTNEIDRARQKYEIDGSKAALKAYSDANQISQKEILEKVLLTEGEKQHDIDPELAENIKKIWSRVEASLRDARSVFSGSELEWSTQRKPVAISHNDFSNRRNMILSDAALDRILTELGYQGHSNSNKLPARNGNPHKKVGVKRLRQSMRDATVPHITSSNIVAVEIGMPDHIDNKPEKRVKLRSQGNEQDDDSTRGRGSSRESSDDWSFSW